MAEYKRFNANTAFTSDTISTGDVFPFQHDPNGTNDMDGKITLANLKEYVLKQIMAGDISVPYSEYADNSYTKAEVNALIESVNQFNCVIVEELPTEDIDVHTIYFVPADDTTSTNAYEEYMYINSNWEKIGGTNTDFDNYYTKSEIDTKFSNITADDIDTKGYWKGYSGSTVTGICSDGATVTTDDFSYVNGRTIEVLFTSAVTGSSGVAMTLNINGLGAKTVKVNQHGTVIDFYNHLIASSYYFLQAYTTLKLMYVEELDALLILGNPTVLSSSSDTEGYTVKADGLIEQWLIYQGTDSGFGCEDGNIYWPISFINTNYSLPNFFSTIAYVAGIKYTRYTSYIILTCSAKHCYISNLSAIGY